MSNATGSELNAFRERCKAILSEEAVLREGGGPPGRHERQRKLGTILPAHERLARLLDHPESFLELGLWGPVTKCMRLGAMCRRVSWPALGRCANGHV